MTDTPSRTRRDGDDIETLLPWYVTGRLEPTERRAVERYLAAHPEAEAQLARVREEQEAVIAANEAIAPDPAALERLMRAVEAEEEARAGAAQGRSAPGESSGAGLGASGRLRALAAALDDWLASLVSGLSPTARGLAAAAALALLIGQAVAIGLLAMGPGASPGGESYVTATGERQTGGERDGARLLVQFAPGARLSDIAALLEPMGARIVSGPAGSGFFEIRLSDGALGEAEIDKAIEALRARRDLVRFVGRAG